MGGEVSAGGQRTARKQLWQLRRLVKNLLHSGEERLCDDRGEEHEHELEEHHAARGLGGDACLGGRTLHHHEVLEQARRERQPAEGEEDERGELHLNGGDGVGSQRVDDVGEPLEREGAPGRGTGFKRPGTLSAPTATVASRRSQGETKAEAKPR